ncbi:GH36-type glycosyl hydrolase domain-containing protein [Rhizomicrobium electricum]|uniref:N,N'-diacetylchitobiose phosphorylase n=1 Tax=Rhizomicrobium electricum TaxID=480070 RepID=A0ABN1EWD9_9PROT|nr:N,N'-diacetylchitobiose phosphorylase [Rhizomicrobium electricum]NIJ50017.1 cellobiose phosphorylase [Rhizomicrobium electricum]
MQYGTFDDAAREYVITRPDTPRSWSNYLGSTEYGAIITNNAGGYSFYKSAAQGRFLRVRFNNVPVDQPGRTIYLRDAESGDFWSAAWQPVGKPLDEYKSECRHGTAYTVITSEYSGIRSETTYFVPLGHAMEVWRVKLTNTGKTPRRLGAFTYVEYANNWSSVNDLVNLQYSQFIATMGVEDGIIDHGTNVHIPADPDNFENADQGRHSFLALVGAPIAGYDTDRTAFLGPYGTYAKPHILETGRCTNSLAAGDNVCGVLQAEVTLAPGETKEFVVLMGVGRAGAEGKAAAKEFGNPARVEEELAKLKAYWHGRLEGLTATTPDPAFNSMLAMWGPFNCLITYAWSRAASLIYAGERDGLGYRDTVQDMLGVMHAIPSEALKRLELMLTGQLSTGGCMPVVKQFAHRPGHESVPPDTELRSDDGMWLFLTVPAYIKESGDFAFLKKVLPYADKGEASVLGHLRRAIEFNLERCGAHGLPCGLSADWNDCIRLGAKGETVMVAFQLRFALKTYAEICALIGEAGEKAWADAALARFDPLLEASAWDGEWYLRGFGDDGIKYGSAEQKEGRIFLNTQTWAVLSGHATGARAGQAMASVEKHLATDHGVMLCTPPFVETSMKVMRAVLFVPGMKENGSIFTHTQGWAVIAETMLGHGSKAYRYYRASMPAAWNDRAETREIEPYVYCQFTNAPMSPRAGASRVPWLSGSAAWAYVAGTQYVLGIRADWQGLVVDPCIPAAWKGFSATRRFRGKTVKIDVQNPNGVEKGVKSLTLNGEVLPGNVIPADKLKDENAVVVVMG